jgi:hypothetical protein
VWVAEKEEEGLFEDLKEVSVHILILVQVMATHSAQYGGDIIMLAVRMG